MEQWAESWGFIFSVDKSQAISFSRCQKDVALKLYGQEIEQVDVRFLQVWFDEKLMWRQQVGKVRDKCKKSIIS